MRRMKSVFAPNLLAGKVAFVTGGGSGIGAGIAKRLAEQGARVGLLGRRAEKLEEVAKAIRDAGGEASCHPCDVRKYDALAAAIDACAEKFGRLDLLVNSAAGNFLAPAASLSANGFRAVVDIDLCGTFNAARAAFGHLGKTRGAIVNITATLGIVPTPLQSHAGAAKAGIEMLTRDLALEWARFGVRVNSVAPGPIADTEGMSRLGGDDREAFEKRVPLGRWGSIDEVCEAVTYLASPAAAWITGTTLLVDGGSALMGPTGFLDMFNAAS